MLIKHIVIVYRYGHVYRHKVKNKNSVVIESYENKVMHVIII